MNRYEEQQLTLLDCFLDLIEAYAQHAPDTPTNLSPELMLAIGAWQFVEPERLEGPTLSLAGQGDAADPFPRWSGVAGHRHA